MSNTYTWKILNLETVQSINGLENVVSVVRWLLTATDDVNLTNVEGTVELENPSSDGFIVYSELSEDQVITWTREKLGLDLESKYHQYLDEKLSQLVKPKSVPADLPWA